VGTTNILNYENEIQVVWTKKDILIYSKQQLI